MRTRPRKTGKRLVQIIALVSLPLLAAGCLTDSTEYTISGSSHDSLSHDRQSRKELQQHTQEAKSGFDRDFYP